MLHLVHPLGCGTLKNTLPYIRTFRAFISSRCLVHEAFQMADDVLIDMIERSGIDLAKLEPLIAQQYDDIQNFPGQRRVHTLNTNLRLTNPSSQYLILGRAWHHADLRRQCANS